MLRIILAAVLAVSFGACMGAGDQRPEPTVGGEQRGPGTMPPAQAPDNYP